MFCTGQDARCLDILQNICLTYFWIVSVFLPIWIVSFFMTARFIIVLFFFQSSPRIPHAVILLGWHIAVLGCWPSLSRQVQKIALTPGGGESRQPTPLHSRGLESADNLPRGNAHTSTRHSIVQRAALCCLLADSASRRFSRQLSWMGELSPQCFREIEVHKTLKKRIFYNIAQLQRLPVKSWWNIVIPTNNERT
jgi:hypothetical protein